ncbi:MAG: acyl-CoA synthetase FdrA [Anaerolineales bacterium]|nr:acyl-CoA synthetase FdrA [Chloroflexota bacterium]MBL7161922.1 acyl-CoA synthetase FdrA [Anaerolineales bacterium]
MAILKVEIRTGAYYDSVILMQLQRSLAEQPGVIDAGVVMGTDANKDVLAQSEMLVPEAQQANPDDLVIVVKADDEAAAQAALDKVDELVSSRRSSGGDEDYRPHSMETAARMLPDAHWVLVSAPGRYAAGISRQALGLGKHVFLYSDNVSLEDEISLKREAASKGLLVMGPDCGTAIVNGIGLGFANKVRKGPIGLVAASGTGMQQVCVRIHQMGGGLTHALGTGGRDLTEAVNAITARQGLDLMARDPDTKVIVLVSKPPSPKVADELVKAARSAGKPVVVHFIGYATASRRVDNIFFATTFDEAAELAVSLVDSQEDFASEPDISKFAEGQRYLRGLFSGGTLQYEVLLILKSYLPVVYSNAPLDKKNKLEDSLVSVEHTVIDLGEDEFTVGRLHPMMDNDLRIRRLEKEAEDPEVAVILLDVVLGYGAHSDPASELAPAIAAGIKTAKEAGRHLEVIAIVSGTDEDPQDMDGQIKLLVEAGAKIEISNDAAARYVGRLLQAIERSNEPPTEDKMQHVDLETLKKPMAGINVGLEAFAEALIDQESQVVHMDWKPVAGGNEKLAGILERMKGK